MKVLVLGAGVIGTTAAWHLVRAGHDVTVVERRDGAGLETSFANGGQISPCHAEPWANPSVLPKMIKWIGRKDAPLLFHWTRWDPSLWAWGIRFLANCPPGPAAVNLERALRIALYSRDCLRQLREETDIHYHQRRLGILHVYRNPREFDHACTAARLMSELGLRRLDKSASECVRIEPALTDVGTQLAGGILTPEDESGDAHLFTRTLAQLTEAKGGVFRYGTTVLGFDHAGGHIDAVITDQGRLSADCVVVATASHSPALLRPLGIRLPLVPAKGYSVTIPVGDGTHAPQVSITDDEHKMVYSRLGDRLRAAGTAEMTGFDTHLTEARWRMVLGHARALFPRAGDFARAEPWTGLRPTMPDSVPVLGRAGRFDNLYLNTGHGTLGWTMSCGSGRIIADLVSGRRPDISMDGLGLDRFRSWIG